MSNQENHNVGRSRAEKTLSKSPVPTILALVFIWVTAAVLLTLIFMPAAHAANDDLKNIAVNDFKQLRADSWRVVGNNVILNGNVYMPMGNCANLAVR